MAKSRSALDRDIERLNLEPVAHLIAMEQPWTLEKIDATELEYRCFLQLVRDYPDESIVPSRDCDIYWHAHILTLGLYLDHCQELFGRPLLHYPFSGSLGPADAAQQAARFQKSQFLLAKLLNRVSSTRFSDGKEKHYGDSIGEVSQSGGHSGPLQST